MQNGDALQGSTVEERNGVFVVTVRQSPHADWLVKQTLWLRWTLGSMLGRRALVAVTVARPQEMPYISPTE